MSIDTRPPQDDSNTTDPGQSNVPPAELAPVFDLIRAELDQLDAIRLTVTWPTADGTLTVDLQRDDWLRVTFSGPRERRYVLAPDWGAV